MRQNNPCDLFSSETYPNPSIRILVSTLPPGSISHYISQVLRDHRSSETTLFQSLRQSHKSDLITGILITGTYLAPLNNFCGHNDNP